MIGAAWVTTKKYYNFAGMMVAMDDGTDLVYFANDHLSSASLVMDSTGGLESENRYMPFGEVRTISGVTNISETDFGYTGQRNNSYIKLLDYKARSYSPGLKRFISPDTIVPDLDNPQSLNRFSYVNNNPINYTDPSGHRYCDWDNHAQADRAYDDLYPDLDGDGCRDYGNDGLSGSDEDWHPNSRCYGDDPMVHVIVK